METRLSLRLKQLRKSFGLSPSQVIKKLKSFDLDFCDQSVYKWEQGNAVPKLETLRELAKIYNCNLSYLIEGKRYKYLRLTPIEYSLLNTYRSDFLFRSILTQIINKLNRD